MRDEWRREMLGKSDVKEGWKGVGAALGKSGVESVGPQCGVENRWGRLVYCSSRLV